MKILQRLQAQPVVLALAIMLLAGCASSAGAPTSISITETPALSSPTAPAGPAASPVQTGIPAPVATGGPPTPFLPPTPAGPYHTPTPGPTFPLRLAGGPDAAAWNAAQTKMHALRTYHRSEVDKRGESAYRSEADIVLPYSAHVTGDNGNEMITINGDTWEHYPGDPPGVFSRVYPIGGPFAFDVTAGAGPIADVKGTGDETIAGARTTHYTFTFSSVRESDMIDAIPGHGDAWIDQDSGYFRRISWIAGDDGGNSAMQWRQTLDFSRFNDPTIKIMPPNQ